MSSSISATAVRLITCHESSADHFATYIRQCPRSETIEIYATGPALKTFQEREIKVKTFSSFDAQLPEEDIAGISSEQEDALAEQIAKACATASVVVTDVGNSLDRKLQKALTRHATQASHVIYDPRPHWMQVSEEAINVYLGAVQKRVPADSSSRESGGSWPGFTYG